jgi:hypothetical protein
MIFTVIGYYESSGQIIADHIKAANGQEAMRKAAEARRDGQGGDTAADDFMLVLAIRGKHFEMGAKCTLDFAGESP